MDLGRALLGVLLPERCVACGGGEELLCPDCRNRLVVLRGTLCDRCGCPTAWPVERCGECAGRRLAFASARAAVAYDGPGRALVVAWKERGLGRVAGLAAELVVGLGAEAARRRPDVRARRRGSRRLAWREPGRGAGREARGALGVAGGAVPVPCSPRPAPTRPHPCGPAIQRRLRLPRVGHVPRSVGVVDDVYTTGATADATARELRRAGARAVHVIAFARAVRR